MMEAKRNLNEYDIIGQAREALERPLTFYNEPEPDGLELSTLDMIREEPVLKVQYPRYKPYLDRLED